ncbi:FAD/NAD(P)-binding protein [Psychroserpens damuponensis]|uniref:FAD/NAD(P)-binding protein n=1 Tax=Psychroserpens damuponensis TaxID=943936 RepID=UPI00069483E3|nr:FAD/NAD(P)-binding protein [Psychroserpens damuponensis]
MKTLAIIGLGPRGLFALETVLTKLENANKTLNIIGFEPSKYPGAGPVWDLDQADSNWINITERALKDLKRRPVIQFLDLEIPSFPSYHDWSNFEQTELEPDKFPPRHKIGTYLNQRFISLHEALKLSSNFNLHPLKIINIEYKKTKLLLHTKTNTFKCDDLLLTIGHQPTNVAKQLKSWQIHALSNDRFKVFESPYPMAQFNDLKNCRDITIGIRGFGLAMLDVMRALVINNFGNFKTTNPSTFECIYYKTEPQNLTVIPFSLDGLPVIPKPLNEEIDLWYKPTALEILQFKSNIEAYAQTDKSTNSLEFIIKPFSKIVARVYHDLATKARAHHLDRIHIESIVQIWLQNQDYNHELIQDKTIDIYQLITNYIAMALGEQAASLDFCIGQVWRHCQPTLYSAFSYANLSDNIINHVIALDESTKCYSYGPPIESMQQLLALVDAKIISFAYLSDPNIKNTKFGWQFTNLKGNHDIATVMINSVLDAPQLLDVNAPVITHLLAADLLEPIHTKLGIETTKNAIVKSNQNDIKTHIAVLGRLAKGSVIGVDAILECFGPRIKNWAQAYVAQLD